MKGRIIKWLLFGAVCVLIVWVLSNLRFVDEQVPLPLQGEAARNPFYAAIELSKELDADAVWERAFLNPPQDSVVVLSSWNWGMSEPRRMRIERWVEAGGRLVVDDTVSGDLTEFTKWTGIGTLQHDYDDDGNERNNDSEKDQSKKKTSGEVLLEKLFGQECVTLAEENSARTFSLCGLGKYRRLTIARKFTWALRFEGDLHAVRVNVGRGSVTMLNASPFAHRDFLRGDHGKLMVAATQLRHRDSVLFVTEEDHASIMKLLVRYGAAVLALLAAMIVLALWRASSRFGPLSAPTELARRSLAEQIRGTGQFALRFGGGRALHAAAVRALRDAAIKRLPNYDRLSSEERVVKLAKFTGVSADDLGPALNYAGARSAHELRNSIAALETARRIILSKNRRSKHGN